MATLFTVMPSPISVICPLEVRCKQLTMKPGQIELTGQRGHLQRSHTVPHRCPRCQETFRDAETLKRHQKATQACEVRRQEDDRILTSYQEEFLKKRSTGKKPDEQKWKDLYANFFPEDKESDIPSPCRHPLLFYIRSSGMHN